MFRFFEGLVDPYGAYREMDAPPSRLWPFLREYARPFRGVFVVTFVLKTCVAATELLLIWYLGRVVDLLARGEPEEIWASYGPELIAAALFVLIVRPIKKDKAA